MNKREIKKEMRQLEREIKGIYRIAAFMTSKQLEPYDNKAKRYSELKEMLEEEDNGNCIPSE